MVDLLIPERNFTDQIPMKETVGHLSKPRLVGEANSKAAAQKPTTHTLNNN